MVSTWRFNFIYEMPFCSSVITIYLTVGKTPPWAIVVEWRSSSNSSSSRMASCIWRGRIRCDLDFFATFPAKVINSVVRYSIIATRAIGAFREMRLAKLCSSKCWRTRLGATNNNFFAFDADVFRDVGILFWFDFLAIFNQIWIRFWDWMTQNIYSVC